MAEACLREFGLMVQGAREDDSMDVCGIASPAAWEFFENLAFSGAKEDRFIEIARHAGGKALRVKNFVGVIGAPDGTQVEILPKTSEGAQDLGSTRDMLWKMLGAVENLHHLETTQAQLRLRDAPLTEALMSVFLDHVAALARRGIRRDYERVEEEERFLRGRLRVARQMQMPPGRQHLFPIEYDLFSENRAENRLLHAALLKVARTSKSPNNQRLARELRHSFGAVSASVNHQADFAAWRTGRDMVHYQPVLPWIRLILNRQCPFSLRDQHAGVSFLFPMEKLFEKYVVKVLERRLAPLRITVHTQVRTRYLADAPQAFQLKPDLILSRAGKWLAVLDTKWKLIDRRNAYTDGSEDPKAGIAQSDMYQLFAYGHKYLGGEGRLALIFPKWSGFAEPLPPFRLGDKLWLEVIPFDLGSDACVLGEELLGIAL
jgi:5-methylcytosine-specific restriction enzyme subunit McrC